MLFKTKRVAVNKQYILFKTKRVAINTLYMLSNAKRVHVTINTLYNYVIQS